MIRAPALRSVRARLTLWHTAVLAVVLAAFATAAYAYLAHAGAARTDRLLLEAADGMHAALTAEREGERTDSADIREVVRAFRFRGFAFAVYGRGGRVVAANVPVLPASAPRDGEVPDPPFDVARLGGYLAAHQLAAPVLLTIPDREGGYRIAVEPARIALGDYDIAVARSLHGDTELLEDVRTALFIALPVALLLAALGGSWLARRSLAPMVVMRERAARIGASNLGERLPVPNPHDEVGQLAGVINDLLARLELAFAQQRRFMADASHELRTPVALVQHESSVVLSRRGRPAAEYEEALTVVRDAGRRLGRIVDDLFLLARADAGDVPLRPAPLDLVELVAECTRSMRSLAAAGAITLTYVTMPEAPFIGDAELLRRVVLNLLDNAIKHSPPGAAVTVTLECADGTYQLTVADTGTGIPAAVRPHIFERFVRADPARGRGAATVTSGAGLGLAIARWVAEIHGGSLVLVRSGAEGTVFALSLPVTPPSPVP